MSQKLLLKAAVTLTFIAVLCVGDTSASSETCNKDRPLAEAGKSDNIRHYNIVLLGSTGNLATKYLWHALFDIFRRQYSKETNRFLIYAGSRREPDDGRKTLSRMLLSLINCGDDEDCVKLKQTFVESVQYQRLKTERDFQTLSEKLYENTQSLYGFELGSPVTFEAGRLIYMAIPPSTYSATAKFVNAYLRPKIGRPWFRVILEKPFGRDLESAQALSKELAAYFDESEVYRIDHYLGKTAVKQILPFRYNNRDLFEPLWNRNYIEQVDIVMKEREDVSGRVSFYDNIGVIRDVMQNHMTELLSLIALDLPADSGNITSLLQSKTQVLRDLRQPDGNSVLVGQYSTYNLERLREVQTLVRNASLTPTFAAAVVFVNNKRWRDVPFLLVSGKKLDERTSYIRIRFRDSRFCLRKSFAQDESSCKWRRQLVFRIGSKGSPSMIAASYGLPKPKIPHTGWSVPSMSASTDASVELIFGQDSTEMVQFFADEESDPYVDLIEATMTGARHLFVPTDFLLASWHFWTSMVQIAGRMEPRQYMGHGKDSERLDFFIARHGVGYGLHYWLDEVNVIHYNSVFTTSSGTSSLPKMTQIPETFRSATLVTGTDRQVITRLVNDIVKAANNRVMTGGQFHLALSGGKTAELLFDELAESSLPWEHVHLWMVDERCDGSNFDLMQHHLLSKIVGLKHRNVHPMPISVDDEPCSENTTAIRGDLIYEKALRRLVPKSSFDFVILGVGPDGHTASLFPGDDAVNEAEKLVVFSSVPSASVFDLRNRRMTLTLPAINSALNVGVLIIGAQKRTILQEISDVTDRSRYPIVGVSPSTGTMTWYVDHAAISGEPDV